MIFEYDDAFLANTVWRQYVSSLEENIGLQAQLAVATETVARLQQTVTGLEESVAYLEQALTESEAISEEEAAKMFVDPALMVSEGEPSSVLSVDALSSDAV